MNYLIKTLAGVILMGTALHFGGLRFYGRARIVENEPLANPVRLLAIHNDGTISTESGHFKLDGIFITHEIPDLATQHFSQGKSTGCVSIEHGTPTRFFISQPAQLGRCGNGANRWFPDFTLPSIDRFTKKDLAEYLVENFMAQPSAELIKKDDAYSKMLLAAFISRAEFHQTPYDGLNRDNAEALATGLLATTEKRAYYNVLWFYGSLFPERLLKLAKFKIDEDLKTIGRGDAYFYLPYIKAYAHDDYLDYVFEVQKNLGHDYEQDHLFYCRILLQAGDWRGFDYVMHAMGNTRNAYFGNGFRNSGNLGWPVAEAALKDHPQKFTDYNLVNRYISDWYFTHKKRVGFNGSYIVVSTPDTVQPSD